MEPRTRRGMRTCAHLLLLASAVALSVGSGFRKKVLKRAPIMPNPARTGTASGVPSVRYGTSVVLMSYAPQQGSCFHIQSGWSPNSMQNTRFILRGLDKVDQKVDTAPTVSATNVVVLRHRSRLVPYTTTVRDTIRDSRGRIIATRDRNVQRIKTVHNTLTRVCFPPNVPTQQNRFLELVGRYGASKVWGVWRLQ